MIASVVFAASIVFLLYVLFGYPLLLARMAARAQPSLKRTQRKSVSIVLAVHNGERFLEDKLRSLLGLQYPRELIEVFVVSDGSTDRTDAIAASFAEEGVQLLRTERRGKPAALNLGISQARGEILVLTDVRQTMPPNSLQQLVDNFADPRVGVVSAELVILPGSDHSERSVSSYWDYEKGIRRNLSRIDSIFGASGAYCAMRRELAVHIPEDMLLDDVYLPLAAFFKGFRLIVDEEAQAFDLPAGLETEFHRKVRTIAGNYQILRCYPQLLTSRNRLLFHFLSYKFGRLFAPFALISAAAASIFLPHPASIAAGAGQVVFYALAAADRFIPDGSLLKKLSSKANTFVVLMGAALCALAVFVVPPQKLWRQSIRKT